MLVKEHKFSVVSSGDLTYSKVNTVNNIKLYTGNLQRSRSQVFLSQMHTYRNTKVTM